MSFHYKNIGKLLTLASLSISLLAGCQFLGQSSNEVNHATLPTVALKYPSHEVDAFTNRITQGKTPRYENIVIRSTPVLKTPENLPKSLFFDSGVNIAYPADGVRGIYVPVEQAADAQTFNQLIQFIDETDLNAMVIDFKSDTGEITTKVHSSNPMVTENSSQMLDLPTIIKTLEEHQIYPIARIVTFKDYVVAAQKPEYSFHNTETGEMWTDGNGSKFINPFLKEVWQYNVDIAIEAAKMGFKDIQFDYVRFPEGFESFHNSLTYRKGSYENYSKEPILDVDGNEVEGSERVAAITDFLKYAKEQLAPYGVKVSADVFGYTAVAGTNADVTGIGQNFMKMAEQIDVISSMIYPSHWGVGFFGIEYPDTQPYDTVDEYMFSEEQVLKRLKNPVVSRPWLQDFTYGTELPYKAYTPQDVQDQIDALRKHNVFEFLLWNANGDYSRGVQYMPVDEESAE